MKCKHIHFAEDIMRRIAEGEFKNGIFLPSERDLATEYRIGRITVRNGLKRLLERKVLQTESTKGYKVISIPDHPEKTGVNIGGLWCSGVYGGHTYDLYNIAGKLAADKGYTFFLNYTEDDSRQQAADLANLLERSVNGLLIVPTYNRENNFMTLGNHALIRYIRASGLPLVMLDRDFPEKDLPCVVNDEYGGGQMAAEHFKNRGHDKVILLTRDDKYYITVQRYGGFRDRCSELGMDFLQIEVSEKDLVKRLPEIRKTILDFGGSAVMSNHGPTQNTIMKHLGDMPQEFLLYDSVPQDMEPRKDVWCVDRPVHSVSEQGMLMLLEEIRCGRERKIGQIRLKPLIREVCMEVEG